MRGLAVLLIALQKGQSNRKSHLPGYADPNAVECALTYGQLLASLVRVLRLIARAVTIFALCCAIGLQWLALQSIAWTSMIIDYSKRGTLCQAIAQTFDGAHPCSLCRVVNKANSTEKKSDLQVLTPTIDMICPACGTTRVHPFIYFDYANSNFRISKVGQSPPVPPPRSILS